MLLKPKNWVEPSPPVKAIVPVTEIRALITSLVKKPMDSSQIIKEVQKTYPEVSNDDIYAIVKALDAEWNPPKEMVEELSK